MEDIIIINSEIFKKPAILFLYSCFFNSTFVVFSKLLGSSFTPNELAFYRVVIIFLIAATSIYCVKKKLPPITKIHPLFFLKSFFALASMVTWFMTINNLPIAETLAVSFSTPILTSVLAIILLKEKFTFNHFIAFTCGLIGIYIIITPEFGKMNEYALIGILSCFLLALSFVIIKKLLNRGYEAIEINYYANLIMIPMSFAITFQQFHADINLNEIILILAFGTCIFFGDFFHNLSYKKSDIITLSPLMFTTIIIGSIYGYIVFDETIELNVMIGAVIVIFGIIATKFKIKRKT